MTEATEIIYDVRELSDRDQETIAQCESSRAKKLMGKMRLLGRDDPQTMAHMLHNVQFQAMWNVLHDAKLVGQFERQDRMDVALADILRRVEEQLKRIRV